MILSVASDSSFSVNEVCDYCGNGRECVLTEINYFTLCFSQTLTDITQSQHISININITVYSANTGAL